MKLHHIYFHKKSDTDVVCCSGYGYCGYGFIVFLWLYGFLGHLAVKIQPRPNAHNKLNNFQCNIKTQMTRAPTKFK